MNADLILYDRLWLAEYIDRLTAQRHLVSELRETLERALNGSSPVEALRCGDTLTDVYELEESLKHTENVLREYLENVQEAAQRLENECRNIDIPRFTE